MRKLKIIITTVCLILLVGFTNVSAFDSKKVTLPTVRDLIISGEITDLSQTNISPLSLDDEIAYTVYIYSSSNGTASSTNTSGHSWIVIRSLYSVAKVIGNYTIPANETMSVGTWGNLGYNGIWYNHERKIRSNFNFANVYYSHAYVLLGNANALSNKVNTLNIWTITKNCTFFARELWNSIYGTQKVSGITPSQISNSIKQIPNYRSGDSNFNFTYTPFSYKYSDFQ